MGAIRLNQMGYSPYSTKQVVYVGEGISFQLYNAENNQLIFQNEMKEFGLNEVSGEALCVGDFSAVQEKGDYYIVINKEKSVIFSISDEQHYLCTDTLLKAFYYQRCGIELEEEYAGKWKHFACHLQPSYLLPVNQDGSRLYKTDHFDPYDTLGGWHDAGDYGRYTVAIAKTVADLLLAYEHFTEAFHHSIGIPESKLEGADILHEAKVGLDFLFKMQRQEDGAVHTKVTTDNFPDVIMPEQDREPLYVFDVSSPATADFAAVMAMAARIYQNFNHDYAKKCLSVAKRAYQWLKKNPEPKLFRNPSGVKSGEYWDNCDVDERYWAAAQMYEATGEEQYHNDFIIYYLMLKERHSLGWKNVSGYGSIAYLFCQHQVDTKVHNQLKIEWLSYAHELERRSKRDGYGITLAPEDYVWGSLMVLLNQSIHLIIANRLLHKPVYKPIIEHNWDYLFGMNPMDISYVTGMGERSVTDPHHRPSAADGVKEPVPGLLAGGPCAALQDEIVKQLCEHLPPAKCYVDHYLSYSTNEIDIYWNSPAVYVGAYLCIHRNLQY